MEDYSRQRHDRGRLRVREHPAHHQGRPVRDLRAPRLVPRTSMFPPMQLEGAEYYLKPMNCPFHILIYRGPRAVLPGAAAAAVRVRHRVPVREVRGGARPDPGPRPHPGRRAHLLHPRADGRRAEDACCEFVLDLLRDYGPDRLLPGAVHQDDPEKFVGSRRGLGAGHRGARAGGGRVWAWSSWPTRAARAFYGPKISVQAQDAIGRTWQLSTIQVDFNEPAAVRPRVPGAGRLPAAADHDPPGAVRLRSSGSSGS